MYQKILNFVHNLKKKNFINGIYFPVYRNYSVKKNFYAHKNETVVVANSIIYSVTTVGQHYYFTKIKKSEKIDLLQAINRDNNHHFKKLEKIKFKFFPNVI